MTHPFVRAPHRTLVALSFPVLVSLIAEPLTGLADTAFLARLGADEVAALGVATTLLSSLFWVFNFLGVGTQTAVAQALGSGEAAATREIVSTSLALAVAIGTTVVFSAWAFLEPLGALMGAEGSVLDGAVVYLRVRLLSAPAVLMSMVAFGALRGRQDMRTPLWIATAINLLNIGLDALLIFGAGPVPALGIAGAAWATVVSQWLGAAGSVYAVRRREGGWAPLRVSRVRALLVVGQDMFLRTGALLLFLALATRAANRVGADAGAAHQAVRSVWMLTAFLLDAYATAVQSLVGWFVGAREIGHARLAARVGGWWALGTGVALVAVMFLAREVVEWGLVPPSAQSAFTSIWWIAALAQPLNALAFVTDGIHWGTGDFRYLRNVMLVSTVLGAVFLTTLPWPAVGWLPGIWIVTTFWTLVRAGFGVVRVWPGGSSAPLGRSA